MLHIELVMAPAPGDILAGEQQLPGGIRETIGLLGEAAAVGVGSGHAAARDDNSISSTL